MADRDDIRWKGTRAEDLTREEAIEAFKLTFVTLHDVMELRSFERVGRYERDQIAEGALLHAASRGIASDG